MLEHSSPNNHDYAKIEKETKLLLLPVDKNEAIAGRIAFEKVAAALSEEAQRKFLANQALLRGFLGLNPEVGVFHALQGQELSIDAQEIIAITERITNNAQFIPHFYCDDAYRRMSFVNRQAVANVARNYPYYFSNLDEDNVVDWMINHKHQWVGDVIDNDEHGKMCTIRHGLLSGFPLHDVVKYYHYQIASQKIHLDILAPEQQRQLHLFKFGRVQRNKKNTERCRLLLQQAARNTLLPIEEELLLRAKIVTNTATGGFIGFDDEKDKRYIQKAENIYYHSGVV